MKKALSVFLSIIFIVSAFSVMASANTYDVDTSLAATSTGTPQTVSEPMPNPDVYDGTLSYTENDDGTVTISYKYNGELKTYTVPNNPIYTSGGFAGTDDVGRSLYNSNTVGIYGENGEHYVGLFYFLWLGEHGDPGVYDLTKIYHKYGQNALNANYIDPTTGQRIYGNIGQFHWMGEPLYGYYYSSDEWVMRKHVELLTNAGIDFLYVDCTNGYAYMANVMKLMAILHEFNEMGYNAPKIVFYTNTNAESTVRTLYNSVYRSKKYPDTWLYVDGKPCIITNSNEITIDTLKDYFTIKEAQWPNESMKNNAWPWMDFSWPQRVFKDSEGNRSAISVSVAQHCGSVAFSDSALYFTHQNENNRGRSYMNGMTFWKYRVSIDNDPSLTNYGYNFQDQWDIAIKQDVPYVLVTGWNEWVAQRLDGAVHRGNENYVLFIDTASQEFSRDIEMMRGGYFDNYYMQMIGNIQRLKGTAPIIIQDARNKINLESSFDQWNAVLIEYTDPTGDVADRNNYGFGRVKYKDTSGSNDIVAAKVTNDTQNAYFYVQTASDITAYDSNSTWMNLYVNVDSNAETGWYGYDFIINRSVVNGDTTSVARYDATTGIFKNIGSAKYQVSGNEMMVAVPLQMLGIQNYEQICMEFKWFDADSGIKVDEMEDFYTYGDAAPLGRLNYVYQNCYIEDIDAPPVLDGSNTNPGNNNNNNNNNGGDINGGGDTNTPDNGDETTTADNSEQPFKSACGSSLSGVSAIVVATACGLYFAKKRKRK